MRARLSKSTPEKARASSVRKSKGQQNENEIHAFQVFVAQARLSVVPESIQKRDPPEPDILCRLENGDQLAFELVEISHPTNAKFFGGAPALADLIEKTYQNLPSKIKARFDERFVNTPLSFEFLPDASRNRIGAKIPGILNELANQASSKDEDWIFSTSTQKVLLSVRKRGRVDNPGRPSFNIAGSFTPDEVVVETVMSKLHKAYETPHPIELLAYFGGLAWGHSGEWVHPLQNVVSSRGLGPFRRIWVQGWSGIEFVYPSLN
jgi:hypothetical protein